MALHLGTDALDQLVVLDSRRAGGHAGHAAQAAVEVRDHLLGQHAVLRQALPGEHDPAPGGVGLIGPEDVGRARVQAEAAVDAPIDHGLLWGAVGVKRGQAQIPPTNSPGLQVREGSKRALTRCISSSAALGAVGPQGSSASRTACGASSSIQGAPSGKAATTA
jgi:hypothetical protein